MSQSEPSTPPTEPPQAPAGAIPASRPPFNQRPAARVALAIILVVALGLTFFAAFATTKFAPPPTAAATATATPEPVPTLAPTPIPPVTAAPGLPAGMSVIAFALTGPDDGWATGELNPDPVTTVPQNGTVLRYVAGVWTQVGPAIPGAYLGGLDMISPTEGWVYGADGNSRTLTLHINGDSWSRVVLPPLADTELGAADVLAMRTSNEGWLAVTHNKTAQGGLTTSLYHDNNGSWSQVFGAPTYITDIAPIAYGEAWVIGKEPGGTSTLYLVQGGSGTQVLTSPPYSEFLRLRAFSSNDIWIEGLTYTSQSLDIYDTPLDYHYNGVSWSNIHLNGQVRSRL